MGGRHHLPAHGGRLVVSGGGHRSALAGGSGIQKQRCENLVLKATQLRDQVVLDQLRRREGCTSLNLLVDHLASSVQDLLRCSRQITTLLVANYQGSVKGERKLRHDRAPVAWTELPGTGPARRSAAVRGR